MHQSARALKQMQKRANFLVLLGRVPSQNPASPPVNSSLVRSRSALLTMRWPCARAWQLPSVACGCIVTWKAVGGLPLVRRGWRMRACWVCGQVCRAADTRATRAKQSNKTMGHEGSQREMWSLCMCACSARDIWGSQAGWTVILTTIRVCCTLIGMATICSLPLYRLLT